jgi:hypothetical protein
MFLRHGMGQAAVCPEVQIEKRYCSGVPQLLFSRSFCVQAPNSVCYCRLLPVSVSFLARCVFYGKPLDVVRHMSTS